MYLWSGLQTTSRFKVVSIGSNFWKNQSFSYNCFFNKEVWTNFVFAYTNNEEIIRFVSICILLKGFVLNSLDSTTPIPLSNHLVRERGQCPAGFLFNGHTQVCDGNWWPCSKIKSLYSPSPSFYFWIIFLLDIDECATAEGVSACFPYKSCRNTIGSFLCEQTPRENERNLQCPPGYRFDTEAATCVGKILYELNFPTISHISLNLDWIDISCAGTTDIDECAEGFDICIREIQYCINTPGGFDCQGKKEFNRYNCPAGYKFNNRTLNCEGEA